MAKKLTDHFTFEELTSTSHEDLLASNRKEAEKYEANLKRVAVELLEPIRVHFNTSVFINSGYRGTELNKRVGGSSTSQHCRGEAADLNVKGKMNRNGQIQVVAWLIQDLRRRNLKWGQILLERGCIHVSIGTKCEVAEYDVPSKKKTKIPELANFPGLYV